MNATTDKQKVRPTIKCRFANKRKVADYRLKGKAPRASEICLVCGDPIPLGRNSTALTCSQKCGKILNSQRTKANRTPADPVKKFCVVCGEPLTGYQTRVCSKACRRVRNLEAEKKSRQKIKKMEVKAKELHVSKLKPKKRKCQYPGCRVSTGANYRYCQTHHHIVTISAGVCHDNYVWDTAATSVVEGRQSAHARP